MVERNEKEVVVRWEIYFRFDSTSWIRTPVSVVGQDVSIPTSSVPRPPHLHTITLRVKDV